MAFEIVPGTRGLTADDVAHILVPGRGRDSNGFGLSPDAMGRVLAAHSFYEEFTRGAAGTIVCSGYKSPVDCRGTAWSPEDSPSETFCGMPEADIMKAELVARGVAERVIHVERHSIDTVTNFLRSESEGHFGDERPVAIVAQADHLRRMMSIIAPRTLRRPYLGVVAPGVEAKSEGLLAAWVSRLVVTGLPTNGDHAVSVATGRATRLWRTARLIGMSEYH
ncbi:YdcF family protein [Micromonospora sp. IBHARD004]|uniref:YdcF family protein n=1 Tax=Micromonospora sp. IBHARD004 TaxID=3457764 RepID=UPI00405A1CF9